MYRPRDLDDALRFLHENSPGVKPLAGGTELLVLIKDRKIETPRYLLDLSPLRKELSYVKREKGVVKIGALTTLWELSKTFLHSEPRYGGFVDTWKSFGTLAIRFSATVGGNVASATQYSDYITTLLVYDAEVETASIRGRRVIPLEKLLEDKRKLAISPDEIIVEIRFKEPPANTGSAFLKFDRRRQLIAGIVTGAFLVSVDSGRLTDVRVAFDMVREKKIPARARRVEEFLRGRELSEENLAKAAEEILPSEMARVDDWWTTAEYRLEMSKTILKRGIDLASRRARGERVA